MSDQIDEAIKAIDTTEEIPKNQMLQVLRVIHERRAQDAKWGEQNHNDYYWLGILAEESGEVAKALIEGAVVTRPPFNAPNHAGDLTAHFTYNKPDTADLEKELTHVAAVAIAWLEAIQRRKA